MSKQTFHKRSLINGPAQAVFDWHKQPDAFVRLCPPWHKVDIVEKSDGIKDGARIRLRIHAGTGVTFLWTLEHTGYMEGRQFCDSQVQGPLRSWFHTHAFDSAGPHSTYLDDYIEYELPFGFLGLLAKPVVEHELRRLFDYRHEVLQREFARGSREAPADSTDRVA